MDSKCTVCHKSKVPNNFLIKCISCFNFWHHRCHLPVIPDPELIAIIRAFNDTRARNSDAALNWKCGSCRKVKPRTLDPVPRSRTASAKDDPIVIDDDDEVVEIIPAPVKRQDSKKSTSAKVAQPVRIIDDPIDFLVSPQRLSSNTNTLACEIGQLSVSDTPQGLKEPTYDGISERTPPPLSTIPEPYSRRASTPSHPQAQSKTPENQESTLPSSRARPRSAHRGSADQPSSPTMPSALAPPSLNNLEGSRIKECSFLERWSTATIHLPRPDQAHTAPSRDPAPLFHPALLPHYINSQYRNSTSEGESDKKPDAWYLAALGKSKPKDAGSAPEQSPGARRARKSRATRYEANRETEHPPNASAQQGSKVPFYFSVNTWMKKNEDALTSFEAIA